MPQPPGNGLEWQELAYHLRIGGVTADLVCLDLRFAAHELLGLFFLTEPFIDAVRRFKYTRPTALHAAPLPWQVRPPCLGPAKPSADTGSPVRLPPIGFLLSMSLNGMGILNQKGVSGVSREFVSTLFAGTSR